MPNTFCSSNPHLHFLTNSFTIWQHLGHFLTAKNISQCCLGNKVGGTGSILNVDDRHGGIVNAEKDNGIHFDSNTVLGKNLESYGQKVHQAMV